MEGAARHTFQVNLPYLTSAPTADNHTVAFRHPTRRTKLSWSFNPEGYSPNYPTTGTQNLRPPLSTPSAIGALNLYCLTPQDLNAGASSELFVMAPAKRSHAVLEAGGGEEEEEELIEVRQKRSNLAQDAPVGFSKNMSPEHYL